MPEEPETVTPGLAEPPRSIRADLLRRFEAWLDGALGSEAPPGGVAAEVFAELERNPADPSVEDGPAPGTDLYSLFAALTALTQEVKLQGRSFRELADLFGPWVERGERAFAAHEEALAEARRIANEALSERKPRERQLTLDAERRVRGEMLGVLIDVRDRLLRGLEGAEAHLDAARRAIRESGWARLFGRLRGRRRLLAPLVETTEAIEKGYRLALARLDDALGALGVWEIPCQGELFDPHSMTVVDVKTTGEAEGDTVLAVYRRGYSWNGEVLRPAEVKVAKAPEEDGDE